MTQHEHQRVEQPNDRRWMQVSSLSALAGGVLMTATALALLSVLTPAQYDIVDPLGALAMILLVVGLPAFYVSERGWFRRGATASFGLMSIGWVTATVGLTLASQTMPPLSETGFLAFLLGFLAAMVGALLFGVVALRTRDATVPRLGAWLLVAALPLGVPFALGFTQYVMGTATDPWAGPMLLYGLAWVVFGRALWGRRRTVPDTRETPQ